MAAVGGRVEANASRGGAEAAAGGKLQEEKWSKMGMDQSCEEAELDEPDGVFERVFTNLYGKMTWTEKLRLFWLSGTLFFIIGGYWLLRSIKDPVIATINGVECIPKAKMLSVLVVTVLVFVYNKLIDTFPNHQLFYIVGGTYCGLFTLIGLMLSSPTYGIYNTNADPYRPLGWISYCAIESFGSIGVSLFWAFANTVYDLESAKKSYGLMVACAQLGSIAGPTLVTQASSIGVPGLYLCGAGCMGLMVVMVWSYVARFGTTAGNAAKADALSGAPPKPKKKKPKAGMMEGLWLVWEYTYIQGVAACSCIFMIEVTILDYAMKVLAKGNFESAHPGDPVAATQAFAAFMGVFGQCTNGMSFAFSLVGTSFVIRRFGLRSTIMLFPLLCLVAMILVFMFPTLEMVFAMMLVLKALSYALNNPCKELLYQPTSDAVKFKAKSWIDIFGQRGSKALGSIVTNQFSDSAPDLLNYGSGIAIGLTVWLLYISRYMGKAFEEYTTTNFVVGADKEEREAAAEELAEAQAADDTSCGVDDPDAPESKKKQEVAV